MRVLMASGAEAWERFDALFDAYWLNAGRQRQREAPRAHLRSQYRKPGLWQAHFGEETVEEPGDETGEGDALRLPAAGEGDGEGTDGRLIATEMETLSKRDLRELMDPASLAEAERAARRLGAAMRDRCSRRQKTARTGRALDMRRILRASLARVESRSI